MHISSDEIYFTGYSVTFDSVICEYYSTVGTMLYCLRWKALNWLRYNCF